MARMLRMTSSDNSTPLRTPMTSSEVIEPRIRPMASSACHLLGRHARELGIGGGLAHDASRSIGRSTTTARSFSARSMSQSRSAMVSSERTSGASRSDSMRIFSQPVMGA